MGFGEIAVKTIRRVFVIPDTRVHEDHRNCIICHAGPFSTMEEMCDHIDAHPERLNGTGVQKDGRWIVLCEPSDYYQEHPTELPECIAHLPSIVEQATALGVDEHEHKLELTDLPKLRRSRPN
jgi:hypothetical protein